MTSPDVPTNGEQDQFAPPSLPDFESPSFAGQLYVPRLAAKQAIVWLAVAIVPIALQWAMWAITASAFKHLPHGFIAVECGWWTRVAAYFSTALFVIVFVASCVLIRAQCFRMLGRLQPGHWIVLLLTFQCILGRIAETLNIANIANHSSHGWEKHAFQTLLWFNFLSTFSLWAFAAVRLRDAVRWKVLLALGSANVIFSAVVFMPISVIVASNIVHVYVWALPCWSAVLVVATLVAVVIDWPRRATRDWPHWLGVSLWTLGNVVVCMEAVMNLTPFNKLLH
jgi:hypothetical protein